MKSILVYVIVAVFIALLGIEHLVDAEGGGEPHSDVVVLGDANFEHLTQASSGSTTGDWLIKFYAPWCGHCKSMATTFERVATELVGVVNVAKVDCTTSRSVSLRFNIKGFPTVLLLSKGRTYIFKEQRGFDELVEFARGGFKLHEGEPTPRPLSGYFAEIEFVFRHAFQEAIKDIKARHYLTYNTVIVLIPCVFSIIIFLLIIIPVGQPKMPPRPAIPRRFSPNPSTIQPTIGRAAPPTSALDTAYAKKDD